MSATFFNMRRRLAAQKAKEAEKAAADSKKKESADKPKKGKVKKDG